MFFAGQYAEQLKSNIVAINGSDLSSAGRYECTVKNHTATTDVFIEGSYNLLS